MTEAGIEIEVCLCEAVANKAVNIHATVVVLVVRGMLTTPCSTFTLRWLTGAYDCYALVLPEVLKFSKHPWVGSAAGTMHGWLQGSFPEVSQTLYTYPINQYDVINSKFKSPRGAVAVILGIVNRPCGKHSRRQQVCIHLNLLCTIIMFCKNTFKARLKKALYYKL